MSSYFDHNLYCTFFPIVLYKIENSLIKLREGENNNEIRRYRDNTSVQLKTSKYKHGL